VVTNVKTVRRRVAMGEGVLYLQLETCSDCGPIRIYRIAKPFSVYSSFTRIKDIFMTRSTYYLYNTV